MPKLLISVLYSLIVGTAFASAEPDTALRAPARARGDTQSDVFDAMSRADVYARAFFSEPVDGTTFFVAYRDGDSTALAAAGLSPDIPDSENLVVGSRISVTVAVLDTGSTPSPPVVSEWDTVLGRGELPMALEWVLIAAGWFGSYTIQSRSELLEGLNVGGAHLGWSGFTILLTAEARDSELEAGPNGAFETARSALELLPDKPAKAARLMDVSVNQSSPSPALRSFYARTLGRAGRCADQLAQARLLAADIRSNAEFIEFCSEGYCLYYLNEYQAQADWSYDHAALSPAFGDCVEQLWKMAIERTVSDQRELGEVRVRAFMRQQEERLNSLPDTDRFADCLRLVVTWLAENDE